MSHIICGFPCCGFAVGPWHLQVRLLAGTLGMAIYLTVVEWASEYLFAAQWFLRFPLWVTQCSSAGVSEVQQSDHRKQLFPPQEAALPLQSLTILNVDQG